MSAHSLVKRRFKRMDFYLPSWCESERMDL